MRRSAIIAAAALASLAAAAHADGTTEHFFTIAIKEGRLTSTSPIQSYIGRNDGRVQSFEIKDWSFERVNKIDSFTVKQKVKPAGTSDVTLKRGTSAGAAGGLGKDLQAQDKMGNAPSSTGIGQAIAGWANDGDEGQERSGPPPQGSLRVKVRLPWLGCEEGKFYPQLVLGSPVKTTYILSDATVTGCANEAVTFSYSKVEFERVKPH